MTDNILIAILITQLYQVGLFNKLHDWTLGRETIAKFRKRWRTVIPKRISIIIDWYKKVRNVK